MSDYYKFIDIDGKQVLSNCTGEIDSVKKENAELKKELDFYTYCNEFDFYRGYIKKLKEMYDAR